MKYDNFTLDRVAELTDGVCEPFRGRLIDEISRSYPDARIMWTIYGHLPEGGVEAFVDIDDETQARTVFDILRLLVPPPTAPPRPPAPTPAPSVEWHLFRAEGRNDLRAERADAALRAFIDRSDTDFAESLGDLLCDLMHWSDRHNFDFEAAMNRATSHYQAETAPQS